jgi:cytochrome b561
MPIRNTTARWGAIAQLFHWVIVALIITQFVLINIEQGLPLGLHKLVALARHKSVGITILGLAILRIVWRLMNPTPALPNTLKPYERLLAHITHKSLYALLFIMPLTGWMMSSARNFPVSWFNLVQLPDLVSPNRALYETLHTTHAVLAWLLVGVAVLHVLAALKHHFVLKDDTLRRMLPFTRSR